MEFEDIRIQIAKFSRTSFLLHSFTTLQIIQRSTARRHPNWKLLVLIKWSFQYMDDSPSKVNISPEELQQLMSDMEAFETGYSGMTFKETEGVLACKSLCNQGLNGL